SALRLLLLPLAWLYGAALMVRHALYDGGILKSTTPEIPTIIIGNLALGGTGKTPMLELALRLLGGDHQLATLSRGYGRKGDDFKEVQAEDSAEEVGDEPLQVKRKFAGVRVFVGADRVASLRSIVATVEGLQAVVLDDAFQHRRLHGSLNVLLTTYQEPWFADHLLPAGNLRDLPSRRAGAQVVVVTKCPALPSASEQREWKAKLRLRADQELFFSGIEYEEPKWAVGVGQLSPSAADRCLLFTGIVNATPLVDHLRSTFKRVEHIAFADHQPFSKADLAGLATRYATFAPGPKMLITTEKDAARLGSVIAGSALEGTPIATIGMRAVILNEPERFAALIKDHVATHTAHR
ncbi:MAG TPA: tetraacyldisaccharide 4'-kinase, partial [Flavobacteriales bacterium]|nr:tetraacyldisaccharide 4'-kinase [Flavobacteriales bacterium]